VWDIWEVTVFKVVILSFNGIEGNYRNTIYLNGVPYKIHTGHIIVKSNQLTCIFWMYSVLHTKKAFVVCTLFCAYYSWQMLGQISETGGWYHCRAPWRQDHILPVCMLLAIPSPHSCGTILKHWIHSSVFLVTF